MLLLRTHSLPSGEQWLYELKLDGYRAIGFRRNGDVSLRSRDDNDFNERYPAVVGALGNLPDNTVVDGEIVAFDQEVRTLSHAKGIFEQGHWNFIQLLRAPFGSRADTLLKFFLR